jgi:hypothetical protein
VTEPEIPPAFELAPWLAWLLWAATVAVVLGLIVYGIRYAPRVM